MHYWIIILSLLCVGCSASAEQVLPTVIEFPTETATVIASETALLSVTNTATLTLEPTVSETSTATETLTMTPNSTASSTSIATASPIPPSATVAATESFGLEGDAIANWLREQDGVDAVEIVSLDRPNDVDPLFYVELIVFPGFNSLTLPEMTKDYLDAEYGITDFTSFSIIISDGVIAVDYFFGFGDWTITELTMVTPPTPSLVNQISAPCNCDSVDNFSCSNFVRQADAQSCYDQCIVSNSSFSRMDADADGLVCESLP